jgi:iron complex outermembrane receptor protein
VPNPDIDPERATNYEIGGAFDPAPGAHLEAAAFYSDIGDALIQIPVALGAPFGTVNQTKNAGSGKYYGVEAQWSVAVGEAVTLGGNATYIKREFTDPTNAAFHLQGVPSTKAFFYVDWKATPQLKITPSLDVAGKRWTVTSSSLITPPQFYQTGAYTLLNLAADYALTEKVSLLVGGKNLTDKNYLLVDGFPEEGRSFYTSVRVRY